jgi:hypothetical protein
MIRLSIYKPSIIGATAWDSCTNEWKTMVRELMSRYSDWPDRDDTWYLINQELQKYHGSLDRLDNQVKEILFDSAEGKTWFLLRYS